MFSPGKRYLYHAGLDSLYAILGETIVLVGLYGVNKGAPTATTTKKTRIAIPSIPLLLRVKIFRKSLNLLISNSILVLRLLKSAHPYFIRGSTIPYVRSAMKLAMITHRAIT